MRSRWGLLSVLAVIVAQTVAVVWWAASTNAKVEALAAIVEPVPRAAEAIARVDERTLGMQRDIEKLQEDRP